MPADGYPLLPDAVPGERLTLDGRAGRLCCYAAGEGPPLLLLHSINAAGSAYEVRPIFEHFSASRRVYAPDLPGFGHSDRSRRAYSVRLFVQSVHDVVERIRAETQAEPLDALALSLSSEFLARAAVEDPSAFRSLALVTPTGFQRGSDALRRPAGGTREVPLLHALLTVPAWRAVPYRLLTRPATIRYFLRRTWGSDDIDPGLAEYDTLTSRQPGAEHAPYAFVSGRLFSTDVRTLYEALRVPVWLAHGTRGDFADFRGADWARNAPRWTVEPFQTGALPHFEKPEAFARAYQTFLDSIGEAADV